MLQVRFYLKSFLVTLNNNVFFRQNLLKQISKDLSKKNYYYFFLYKSLLKFGLVSPLK